MSFHRCATPGCRRRIHVRFWMCPRCTSFVPQHLKSKLHDAYGIYRLAELTGPSERRAALRELRAVQRACVEAVPRRKGDAA